MKSLRCAKCDKAILSIKKGMIQWKHNPALNQAFNCQIIHLDCGYAERKLLIVGCFTEEIRLDKIDLDKLVIKWDKVIYQGRSFKDTMDKLVEKL